LSGIQILPQIVFAEAAKTGMLMMFWNPAKYQSVSECDLCILPALLANSKWDLNTATNPK
jgi:hypothetical protein